MSGFPLGPGRLNPDRDIVCPHGVHSTIGTCMICPTDFTENPLPRPAITLTTEQLAAIGRTDRGHGVHVTITPHGLDLLAVDPPTIEEQLRQVLAAAAMKGSENHQQWLTSVARAVLEAGDWTPRGDLTDAELIRSALNYHASEIEGTVINPSVPRKQWADAFTRAVTAYRERRGMTGVAVNPS